MTVAKLGPQPVKLNSINFGLSAKRVKPNLNRFDQYKSMKRNSIYFEINTLRKKQNILLILYKDGWKI